MEIEVWEHHHRFGHSTYIMYKNDNAKEFTQEDVINEHELHFEPDLGESLTCTCETSLDMEKLNLENESALKVQAKSDLANILFALRFLQSNLADHELYEMRQGSAHFTENDAKPYSADEIDGLCERLNF